LAVLADAVVEIGPRSASAVSVGEYESWPQAASANEQTRARLKTTDRFIADSYG
jgi:hypothetical protein